MIFVLDIYSLIDTDIIGFLPAGVIDWSGGAIDWNSATYKSAGYYSMELGSFSVNCADLEAVDLATTGTGNNITSWVYTGTNDSTTGNEPGFQLNKDPITYLKNPASGGAYGQPGYEDQTANTKGNSNMWDGSGDTGANDAAANGSSGSSGGGGGITAASAKKYGIPIAAGVVGLILLWALVVWCVRRRRRNAKTIAGVQGAGGASSGSTFGNVRRGSQLTGGGIAGGKITSGASGGKYTQLNDAGASSSDYDLPMGAEKQGYGVGPASGPRPNTGSTISTDSYAMTPQVTGAGAGTGAGGWNRVKTPVIQQYQSGTPARGGWGTGGGYSQPQGAAGGVYYHQQPYSSGGRGYSAQQQQQPHYPQYAQRQQQPAWAQAQQPAYASYAPYQGAQQQQYGTPRYYS